MPTSRESLALVAMAVTLAACSGGGSPDATAQGRPSASSSAGGPSPSDPVEGSTSCDRPAPVPFPAWVPHDLPLPKGIYASRDFGRRRGYFQGLFVTPLSTTDLARFVLQKWPKAGYQLGKGDSEPDEIEDVFNKPPAVGAFKAQDQPCHPAFTLVLMIYAPNGNKLGPPDTQPRAPLGSPPPTTT